MARGTHFQQAVLGGARGSRARSLGRNRMDEWRFLVAGRRLLALHFTCDQRAMGSGCKPHSDETG